MEKIVEIECGSWVVEEERGRARTDGESERRSNYPPISAPCLLLLSASSYYLRTLLCWLALLNCVINRPWLQSSRFVVVVVGDNETSRGLCSRTRTTNGSGFCSAAYFCRLKVEGENIAMTNATNTEDGEYLLLGISLIIRWRRRRKRVTGYCNCRSQLFKSVFLWLLRGTQSRPTLIDS